MRRQSIIPAICYDFTAISRFCRSVAMASAFQKHTRTEWVRYRDSAAINVFYSVLFWKTPPGSVEVRQADAQVIEESVNHLHERFLLTWLRKLHTCGPQVATHYLAQLAKLRQSAREDVQDLLREAAATNRAVTGETAKGIESMARIKLGATVGVAALGAGGALVLAGSSALIVSGLSAGYSMSCSLIKEYENGGGAIAAGVSIEAGKATAGEALGMVAEHQHLHSLAREARAEQIVKSAQGVIREQSARIAQLSIRNSKRAGRLMTKSQSVLGTAQRQVATHQALAAQARSAATAAKVAKAGVPLVFAAWDIVEGIKDYNETIGAL